MSTSRPPAPIDQRDVQAVMRPVTEARTLPREAYLDPAVLAYEQEWFFAHGWVCIGRANDLVRTGDQRAISVGGVGVLLTRGAQGELNVFANTCAHRGHELLPCGAEVTNRATVLCPYHGWVYDLDGSLRHTPRFGAHESFDPAESGIARLRSGEWGGWVFVNVSGDAPELVDVLGNLATSTVNFPLDALVVGASHQYELAANWKIASENYNECYHCPLIHPELSRVSPPDSGEELDGHTGAWIGGTMELIPGAQTMSISGASEGEIFPTLVGDRFENEILYSGVFPNLLISFHPDYVITHRMEPIAPGLTRIECQWLFLPEVLERPGFDPSYAVDFWDLTNRQDWAAVESVQRGLASPTFRPGWFGVNEDDVHRFASLVAYGYSGGDPLRAPALPVISPDVRSADSASAEIETGTPIATPSPR